MERRKQPRANFGGVLFNKYIDGLPHAVELLELSTNGMLVRTILEPDVPRDFYSLELGLPGCAERIWLWARKVWTRDNRQALRFMAVDPRDHERIDELVRQALAC